MSAGAEELAMPKTTSASLFAQQLALDCALSWPFRLARCHARVLRRIAMQAFAAVLVALLLPAPVSAATVEPIALPGGTTVWLVHEPGIPLVSVRLAFPGGAVLDPVGKEGLGSVMASLLTEGAGKRDALEFARELSVLGAKLSTSVGRDQTYASFDAVSSRIEHAAALLREALIEPRFDADALERVKRQRLADLEQSAREPRRIALDRWYAETFPGQPYGRPVDGTEMSVRSITLDDVKAQHRRLLVGSGLKVVIVGDIDGRTAASLFERSLKDLPRGANPLPAAAQPRRIGAPVFIDETLPIATAAFGMPAIPVADPDYPALEVLNHIIGSGDFDSTLMDEIRVKRGLAYAVSTSLVSDTASSLLVGGMSSRADAMTGALDTLRAVLQKTAAGGQSAEQVDAAKSYLVGTSVLDHDGNARRAASLLRLWLQGASPTEALQARPGIRNVQPADVARVARRILAVGNLNLVVVGAARGGK